MRKGFIFDPVVRKSLWVEVKPGPWRQPDYSRGPRTRARAERLLKFRSCIQETLSGKTFANRGAVREAFAKAAKDCSGKTK